MKIAFFCFALLATLLTESAFSEELKIIVTAYKVEIDRETFDRVSKLGLTDLATEIDSKYAKKAEVVLTAKATVQLGESFQVVEKCESGQISVDGIIVAKGDKFHSTKLKTIVEFESKIGKNIHTSESSVSFSNELPGCVRGYLRSTVDEHDKFRNATVTLVMIACDKP